MKDYYTVGEDGLTRDGYRRLVPVSKRAMYVKEAFVLVFAIAVFGIVTFYREGIFGDATDIAMPFLMASYVLVFVLLASRPTLFYNHYCYRIDDDKVEVRKGIFVIDHTLVPIERVHQVNVRRGPVNNLYGLADVVITTAGGTVVLDYLTSDEADSIATRLNDCVVRLLKERDRFGGEDL
ncbi:MAG: PH domain-containing protein [archaeon]|nr:PH domain-containing protein [archaeon]